MHYRRTSPLGQRSSPGATGGFLPHLEEAERPRRALRGHGICDALTRDTLCLFDNVIGPMVQIVFVRNQSMTDVLSTIETTVPDHSAFFTVRDKTEETWLNYDFRLPDDPSRGVRMAILAFHFPRSAS